MATTIGGVTVDFIANTASFETGVGRVEKAAKQAATGTTAALERIGKGFTAATSGLDEFARGFFSLQGVIGGLVAGAGVASFVDGVSRSLNTLGDIGDVAARVSVGTEALQSLRFAATQSGLAADQLDDGLQELSIKLGEYKNGDSGAKQAFDQLGPSADIAVGKLRSTDQVFVAVAESSSKLEDKVLATALASQVFGEDVGPRLLPLLNQGGAGIDALCEKAEAFGLVIGDDVIRASDAARDKLGVLADVLEARVVVAFANAAPQVDAFAGRLLDSVPAIEKFVADTVAGIGRVAGVLDFLFTRLLPERTSGVLDFKIQGGLLDAVFRRSVGSPAPS